MLTNRSYRLRHCGPFARSGEEPALASCLGPAVGWYVQIARPGRGSPPGVEGGVLSTDRPLSSAAGPGGRTADSSGPVGPSEDTGRLDDAGGPGGRPTPPKGPAGWAEPRSARFEAPRRSGAEAAEAVEEQAPRVAELAHWGLRLVSSLVDFVVPFVVAGILVRVWAPVGILAYVVAVAFVIWNLVVQGMTGQTVGKRLVGTSLVGADDGEVVGPGLSILRYLGHIVDVLPFYLGFLWPLWDHKRQTFSDKMCRTVVIVV